MKKVAVLLAEGFETIEALTSVDILRRAGVTCTTFGINEVEVTTSHSITIRADEVLNDEIYNYDVVILPGGMTGAVNLRDYENVIEKARILLNNYIDKALQEINDLENNKYKTALKELIGLIANE